MRGGLAERPPAIAPEPGASVGRGTGRCFRNPAAAAVITSPMGARRFSEAGMFWRGQVGPIPDPACPFIERARALASAEPLIPLT